MKVIIDSALNGQLAVRQVDRCRTMVLALIQMLKEHGMDAPHHYAAHITPMPTSDRGLNEISLIDDEGRMASVLFAPYGKLIIVAAVGGCVEGDDWYDINVPEADRRFERFLKVAAEKRL